MQKGFSTLAIIIVVVVLAVFGVAAFIYKEAKAPPADSPPAVNSLPPVIADNAPSNAGVANQPMQTQPTQPTKNMQHLITIKTTSGDIQFQTYDADAPKAVQNFISLAQKGFYNNVIFHRVIKGFMIQGGDPTGTGMGGPGYKFEDELNPATPSYQQGYVRGVVAMANAGPNTNGSQFFIMLADTPLPHAYTIFGKVTKGQDVVDAIGNLPTDANDRPANPPAIKSVTVEEVK